MRAIGQGSTVDTHVGHCDEVIISAVSLSMMPTRG